MAVKFSFLEEYLDTIPPTQREIVEVLDKYIVSCSDKIKFKFSYGLPFYQYIKNLCYINCKKTGEVDLCFWNGKHLDIPELEWKGRVMIKSFTYQVVEDIEEEILIYTLQEAIRIQEKIY
ncbi:MAG: DUF1801 domain-containing protein [Chlorobiota bacterium]